MLPFLSIHGLDDSLFRSLPVPVKLLLQKEQRNKQQTKQALDIHSNDNHKTEPRTAMTCRALDPSRALEPEQVVALAPPNCLHCWHVLGARRKATVEAAPATLVELLAASAAVLLVVVLATLPGGAKSRPGLHWQC